MATKVQRVARQAYKTFKTYTSQATLTENLRELRSIASQITAGDVGFDHELLMNGTQFGEGGTSGGTSTRLDPAQQQQHHAAAPVTYVHLYEDHIFTMGIFVLKDGVRLPLHDHPGMYGVIKVLHGSALFKCYSEQRGRTAPAELMARLAPWYRGGTVKVVRPLAPTIATPLSAPCLLTPDDSNFHEIHAHDGPMAFLDILAPPYDHDTGARQCHYYRELSVSMLTSNRFDLGGVQGPPPPTQGWRGANGALGQILESDSSEKYLIEVPQPSDFWCDPGEYRGPEIYRPDEPS